MALERIDPADALDALSPDRFDLAVVVVGERARDAFELLRTIATDESLREQPVIAFVRPSCRRPTGRGSTRWPRRP